ncbi:DUF7507 domain-containing protein [Microbacterium galbinum]|uniref:DUF11 domain-containing protein n=1 Tax=Microbacterium galbinum TaxID=2851646 RepID=A0ABY4INB2_9MICO|nr:hypothetical protein [Microbacterium galbinum]UPL14208.1 DUF11 domain-containing protein [Microbacterium galbinum]
MTVSTRTFRGARRRVLAALGGVFALALAAGAAAVPAQAAEVPLAVTPGACVPADVYVNSGEDPLTLQRYGADAATGALALESSVALDRSFGDIAWNADETVLYGVDWTDPQHLFTIDAATGVSTDAGEILFDDGSAPFEDNWLNSLSATADGRLLAAGYLYTSIWFLDPETARLTDAPVSFPMLADGETYLASGGDFLTLDSGLILGLAHDGADRGFLVLFDFAAGTSTVVGQVPLSFGAALSGGRVYLAASTGEILVLDGIPTTASEAPLATSVVATTDLPLYGATSRQDSGACPVAALTFVKNLTGNDDADGSGTVTVGDTLSYTLTATNTGETALTTVTVDDPLTGQSTSCERVEVGAACVLAATHRVTDVDLVAGQIVNTGRASSAETDAVEDAVTTPVVAAPAPQPSTGGGGAAAAPALAESGGATGLPAIIAAMGLLLWGAVLVIRELHPRFTHRAP